MSQCHTISVTLWKEYSRNITPCRSYIRDPSCLAHMYWYFVFMIPYLPYLPTPKQFPLPQHRAQRGGVGWKLQLGLPPWLGAPVSTPCTCLPGRIQIHLQTTVVQSIFFSGNFQFKRWGIIWCWWRGKGSSNHNLQVTNRSKDSDQHYCH